MRKAVTVLVVGVSSLLFARTALAQAGPVEVFVPYALPALSDANGSVVAKLRAEHAAGDIRIVRLNVGALTNAPANSVRTLTIGGATFNSVTRQTTKLASGPVVWKGTIASDDATLPAGNATLVVDGQSATGTVEAPDGRRFQIRPVGGDATAVIQLDYARLPKEEPATNPSIAAPHGPGFSASRVAVAKGADVVPTIDLLVVYTKSAATSSGGIDPLITLAAIETNDTFVNSGISARVGVVATMATKIVEGGRSFEAIMADLVNSGEIGARRNAAHADVVVLLINQPEYCGLADDIKASPDKAYVLVHYGCATGYYSFGHEIGHLIGARHNVEMDADMTPYSYGHGLSLVANHFRTVMGYACDGTTCDPRIPYWSNPNVLYRGKPTGNAAIAYDARVWNERAAEVALFR